MQSVQCFFLHVPGIVFLLIIHIFIYVLSRVHVETVMNTNYNPAHLHSALLIC